MKHFHNSVNLQGVGLHFEEENAQSQEKNILLIFKLFSERSFPTYQIEDILKSHKVYHNHDSVKRAISTLTEQGLLVKSEKPEVKGRYRVKVHTWQYKSQPKEIAA